jgi:hypothetical protein
MIVMQKGLELSGIETRLKALEERINCNGKPQKRLIGLKRR